MICVLCCFVVLMIVKSVYENDEHRRNREKKQGKKFNLKTRYRSLEFSENYNIHNSSNIPHFCFNYLVNPCQRTTHDARFSSADSHIKFSVKVESVTRGVARASFLIKRLWHLCFPVNFVKFLGTPLFIEHLWWLLQH